MPKDGITDILSALTKKHKTLLGRVSDVVSDVEGLSTGNLSVDYVTGVGGLPKGRIVELYGPPSSGKTTTALQCAAELQAKIITMGLDRYILYLDFEQAIDAEYCTALGIDVNHDSFIVAQPAYLEQGGEIAHELISTGKIPLLIVDSVASMAPRALFDGEFDQRTSAMNRARLLNGWLLRLIGQLREHDACAVFINHLMESIQMTGPTRGVPTETTPGGKGLKFYASLRLKYQQVKQVPGEYSDALSAGGSKGTTSTLVKVKVTKNKVGPPFREAEVRVQFGTGFDNAWSALQVLVAHKKITRDGSWFKIKDAQLSHADLPAENRFHGQGALLHFADTHPAWRAGLILRAVQLADEYGDAALETGDLTGDEVEQTAGIDSVEVG